MHLSPWLSADLTYQPEWQAVLVSPVRGDWMLCAIIINSTCVELTNSHAPHPDIHGTVWVNMDAESGTHVRHTVFPRVHWPQQITEHSLLAVYCRFSYLGLFLIHTWLIFADIFIVLLNSSCAGIIHYRSFSVHSLLSSPVTRAVPCYGTFGLSAEKWLIWHSSWNRLYEF